MSEHGILIRPPLATGLRIGELVALQWADVEAVYREVLHQAEAERTAARRAMESERKRLPNGQMPEID